MTPLLTKEAIEAKSVEIGKLPEAEAEKAAKDLHAELTEFFQGIPAMNAFNHMPGRGECAIENGSSPLLEVSFDMRFSTRYSTEVVFNLRKDELNVYVRTWDIKNESSYELAKEGWLDDDAKGESVEEMVTDAVRLVAEHRIALLQDLGVTVSPETRAAMITQGTATLTV